MEFVTPRAARRIALAVVASVVALLLGVGAATSPRSDERAPDRRAEGVTLLSTPRMQRAERTTPVHRLTPPTGAPTRPAWLRGGPRRAPRTSLSAVVAIATSGCFPDHCAVATRQMIARVARGSLAGLSGTLGAGPTRAPPRLS